MKKKPGTAYVPMRPNNPRILLNTCERYKMCPTISNTTYLNHKNLYKQLRIGRICHCCIRTSDTDRHTTYHVTQADSKTGPEQRIARKVVFRCPEAINSVFQSPCNLGRKHNRHNDTIDGHNFTKDDADQILCRDPRRAHAGTKNRRSGYKYTPVCWKSHMYLPCGTHYAETNAQTNPRVGPHIRTCFLKKCIYGKLVARAWCKEYNHFLPVKIKYPAPYNARARSVPKVV